MRKAKKNFAWLANKVHQNSSMDRDWKQKVQVKGLLAAMTVGSKLLRENVFRIPTFTMLAMGNR